MVQYIKVHRKCFYTPLLTKCKLNSYLADIDRQTEGMFLRLVKYLVEKENVTEEPKATDMML